MATIPQSSAPFLVVPMASPGCALLPPCLIPAAEPGHIPGEFQRRWEREGPQEHKGLIRGDGSRQGAGCSLHGVGHPWKRRSCCLRFPMPGCQEMWLGMGEGRDLPVAVSLSRVGNSSLPCSAGKPEDPKESLEWGLSCFTLGIWDEFPHGKSWSLHCPGAAPPSCFPPLPSSSSLPKPWMDLTQKFPTVPC